MEHVVAACVPRNPSRRLGEAIVLTFLTGEEARDAARIAAISRFRHIPGILSVFIDPSVRDTDSALITSVVKTRGMPVYSGPANALASRLGAAYVPCTIVVERGSIVYDDSHGQDYQCAPELEDDLWLMALGWTVSSGTTPKAERTGDVRG